MAIRPIFRASAEFINRIKAGASVAQATPVLNATAADGGSGFIETIVPHGRTKFPVPHPDEDSELRERTEIFAADSPYTALLSDDIIVASSTGGTVNVLLPLVSGIPTTSSYYLKHSYGSTAVIVTPQTGDTIEGATGVTSIALNASWLLSSDGAVGWEII